MKQIYNEGRVVGLSAYELFLRSHPDTEHLPSEKDWLASMIGSGSAMILRCPYVNSSSIVDIPLPSDTNLCAASTIVASFFLGECTWSSVPGVSNAAWATDITSYGSLISNTSTSSPSNDGSTVPGQYADLSSTQIQQLKNYMKIVDGVIIQPGKWKAISNKGTRAKDLYNPNFTKEPVLRLSVNGQIPANASPYILLVGFTENGIITGSSGLDGSATSANPENGDFIGPAIFPWASKVIFTTPTLFGRYGDNELKELNISLQTNLDNEKKPTYIESGLDNSNIYRSISLAASASGALYPISNAPSKTALHLDGRGNLNWSILLEALANDRGIDVFTASDGSSKLKAGFGINITQNENKSLTIENSLPDLDLESWHTLRPYKSSTDRGNYSVSWGPCRFGKAREGDIDHTIFYRYFGAFPDPSTSAVSYINKRSDYAGGIRVEVIPITDSSGHLKKCYLRVSSYGYKEEDPKQQQYHLGCSNLSEYTTHVGQSGTKWVKYAYPRHGTNPQVRYGYPEDTGADFNGGYPEPVAPAYSIVCVLELDQSITVAGRSYNLSGFKGLTSIGQSGNDIWNVHGIRHENKIAKYVPLRGSWPVSCELRAITVRNNVGQDLQKIAVVMVSIGDGWNDGFNNAFDEKYTPGYGDLVYTPGLNMTLEGILTYD